MGFHEFLKDRRRQVTEKLPKLKSTISGSVVQPHSRGGIRYPPTSLNPGIILDSRRVRVETAQVPQKVR